MPIARLEGLAGAAAGAEEAAPEAEPGAEPALRGLREATESQAAGGVFAGINHGTIAIGWPSCPRRRAASPSGVAPSTPCRPPARAAAAGPHSGPAARAGTHCYAVWAVPGAEEDFVGVQRGGAAAWRCISARLAGARYVSGRDRLRRFASLKAAVDGFFLEHRSSSSPPSVKVFDWTRA